MSSSGASRGNILILASQVPFSRGGAEVLIDRLKEAIFERGFSVDIVTLPFSAEPKSQLLGQMLSWRNLSLQNMSGRRIDMVIPTKFPTYFVNHPNKVVWLIHQHRQAYELVGTRYGDFSSSVEDEAVRSAILKGDVNTLAEARKIFTISDTVTRRVKDFLGLEAESLPPPLPWKLKQHEGEKGNYILSVGRLCSTKRTDMIIRALPYMEDSIRLKIVGTPDEPHYENYLKSEVQKHHVTNRVDFLGSVPEDTLLDLYANCLGVFYGPYDEDYGFVTYEAAKSGKPTVTTKDSGYVQEVVRKENLGIVTEPEPEKIAEAFKVLVDDDQKYEEYKKASAKLEIPEDWSFVAEQLLRAGGLFN